MPRRSIGLAAAVTSVALGLGAVQLLPGAAPVAYAHGLVRYDSCAELLEHYREELKRSAAVEGWVGGGFSLPMAGSGGSSADRASGAPESAVGNGPTGTNVQEQGVDEPDMVKLRDGRLVVLTGTMLRILGATSQPQELGRLDVGGHSEEAPAGHGGGELLLVGDRAVVVLPGWRQADPVPPASSGPQRPWSPGHPTTRLVLVDLTSATPRLMEEATYDARYVSARLVDGTLRLVTTTSPQLPSLPPVEPGPLGWDSNDSNRPSVESVKLADVLPQLVRRHAAGSVLEQGSAVSCDEASYAPGSRGASTLLVTTFRPQDGELRATDRDAVTTDGDLVYSSKDRLYVATSRWGTFAQMTGDTMGGVVTSGEVRTQLHAFDTSSATSTAYTGSGSVPGYVYGRWALSEHEGVLRVATTRQAPWANDTGGGGQTSSMIVKLAEADGQLVETGRISGLGRSEHIKAVRYFGDLAAVVTFRQTDPLYLIDLGDTPKVLGELKIPGFSTYLHPLGDGLLLGLGHDATNAGEVTGMQVSVFDISDPGSPRQVDRLSLGNGWSPALEDSRAFTYDPQRRVAAMGFTKADPQAVNSEQSSALAVRVLHDGMLTKAGELALKTERPSRVLLDGSTVFAITDMGVVAADAASWTRTGDLFFGQTSGATGLG